MELLREINKQVELTGKLHPSLYQEVITAFKKLYDDLIE